MRKIIFLGFLLSLVLASCVKEYVCSDGTTVTDLNNCPPKIEFTKNDVRIDAHWEYPTCAYYKDNYVYLQGVYDDDARKSNILKEYYRNSGPMSYDRYIKEDVRPECFLTIDGEPQKSGDGTPIQEREIPITGYRDRVFIQTAFNVYENHIVQYCCIIIGDRNGVEINLTDEVCTTDIVEPLCTVADKEFITKTYGDLRFG